MDPAPTDDRLPEAVDAPPASAYPLFLAGLGSWFGAWGIQTVVFQWLVVEGLGASPELVGTAQMMVLLPSLFLLLVGGATADRIDRGRALLLFHALAALGCLGLGLVVALGALSYPLLIAYALFAGTLQAFVIPTRDAQLSDVVDSGLSRAVAGLTIVQFGGQGLGAIVAGVARFVGAAPVLGLQAIVVLVGMLPLSRLPRRRAHDATTPPALHLRELPAGILEVARSPVLRAVMLLNVTVGLTFVGAYLVLMPLLVRELYGGGADKMGLLASMIPLGSITVSLWILSRGGLIYQGRALLLGQGFAGLCLGALALGLPFWGAALSTVGWGLGAAFAINASRSLFQQYASVANRGRVLSVYSLAILGVGPLGAFLTGVVAERIGTLATFGAQSIAMTAIIAGAFIFTRFARVQ